jgi:hypothetical protein
MSDMKVARFLGVFLYRSFWLWVLGSFLVVCGITGIISVVGNLGTRQGTFGTCRLDCVRKVIGPSNTETVSGRHHGLRPQCNRDSTFGLYGESYRTEWQRDSLWYAVRISPGVPSDIFSTCRLDPVGMNIYPNDTETV